MTGNNIFDWSKFKIPSVPFFIGSPFNFMIIILRLWRPYVFVDVNFVFFKLRFSQFLIFCKMPTWQN